MSKEPKIKFDNLPEGAVVLDKGGKKDFFKSMQEWSAVEWFWGIIGGAVCLAVVIITQEGLHVSRQWAWAIWMSGIAIFVFIVRQINEHKKKREKKKTN